MYANTIQHKNTHLHTRLHTISQHIHINFIASERQRRHSIHTLYFLRIAQMDGQKTKKKNTRREREKHWMFHISVYIHSVSEVEELNFASAPTATRVSFCTYKTVHLSLSRSLSRCRCHTAFITRCVCLRVFVSYKNHFLQHQECSIRVYESSKQNSQIVV